VSTTVIWALVGLGLLALAARRRSVSGAVVALQSVVLAAEALRIGATEDAALLLVGSVLLAKAAVIGALLWVAVARSRHARPLGDDVAGITRIGSAVVVALLAAVLLPSAGLDPPAAADGAAALVAIGLAMLLTRRAAAFGLLALLVAENGLVVAGRLPIVVELGIAFDAILVISVAVVFHGRIQSAFGTTDTSVLSALRD
jgi:hydrogenase-4 component E